MADKVTIYHNPRCSKSRQTLKLLQDNGIEPEIVEYLDTPPSAKQLEKVLKMLGVEPDELMRKNEAVYKELGIKGGGFSRKQLIELMVENPKLIERPIVIKGGRAALGRPPESVLNIL